MRYSKFKEKYFACCQNNRDTYIIIIHIKVHKLHLQDMVLLEKNIEMIPKSPLGREYSIQIE